MKLLIDMNLSPEWVGFLRDHGVEAVHWSSIGRPDAPDEFLLEWARTNGCIVFSHDLDFSRLLALTHEHGPSVLQVRTDDVLPSAIGELVLEALRSQADLLAHGALVVIDSASTRARLLPLKR